MEQNSSGPGPDGGFNPAPLRDVQNWRRSRSDRMVAGVCGGIGRALNIDPVLIRVVMAVLILSGPGIIFYAAAWVLMPDEGSDRSPAQGLLGDRVRPDHPWLWPIVIGVCVFAAIALMSSFNFGKLVPGPLLVLGLLWLFVFRRKNGRWGRRQNWTGRQANWTPQNPGWTTTGLGSTGTPPNAAESTRPQDATTSPYAGASQYGPTSAQTGPPPPPAGPSSSATQRPQDRVTEPVQAVWTEDDPLGLYVDEPPAPVRTAPAAPPAKGLRGVKSAVVVLTGLALAISWLAGAAVPLMLVIGLGTLGLGMLIGGFLGRTMALLPLGILLALGVAVSMIFPTIPRNFTDTNFVATPETPVNATNTAYHFDAGSVHLDLTKATFAKDAKVVVDGRVGEIVVKVPKDVDISATVRSQTGEMQVLGDHKGGHNLPTWVVKDLGADKLAGESVTLDLNLKLGSIKVERG
jgi:phage shock protein PspC (stress-responsive transcriptional regulator)